MSRYTYTIKAINLYGIECFVGRLYRHGALVHETTAMSHAQAYTSIYRHCVRLTELDEIEKKAA